MKNSKTILVKTLATAALGVAGIVTVDNMQNNTAQAAVVQNDASVFTANTSTVVYGDYSNPKKTGQVLPANTDWKIIKTAYDDKGQKWYDLGKNQWVKVKTTAHSTKVKSEKIVQSSTSAQAPVHTQSVTTQKSAPVQTHKSTNYTSKATGSEASAKEWIAGRESGGSYSARNGQYIGKYQLSASYLGGDYSAANQEKAADNYVKSHYGSWSAAKSFWLSNGYY